MTRRCRVLHTTTIFPLSSGAAESTKLTLNLLDRSRFEPFLATAPGQSMDAEVAPDVVRIPLRRLRRPINPIADLSVLVEIYGAIRRFGFDAVHTHNAKDGIVGRWAAHFAGTSAIVHTIHNVSFEASASNIVNGHYAMQERWAARITDRLLAVSAANSAKYLRRGIGRPEQYRILYSGLDLARYNDDGRPAAVRRAQLGLPTRPGPWVGWLGRFNRQKDPLTFVRAAHLVSARLPSAQFIVCGDDPLDESLEGQTRALASELGLSDAMHFVGFQRDVANILRSVDIMMHSSRYEGMGRLICEALACERPVAGTAVDGVVEVIESGRRGGILAPPGDAPALATATVQLLTDTAFARALASSGHRWVVQHLSAERMVQGIEEVYLGLLDRRQT